VNKVKEILVSNGQQVTQRWRNCMRSSFRMYTLHRILQIMSLRCRKIRQTERVTRVWYGHVINVATKFSLYNDCCMLTITHIKDTNFSGCMLQI
jgi:hypothetical protein